MSMLVFGEDPQVHTGKEETADETIISQQRQLDVRKIHSCETLDLLAGAQQFCLVSARLVHTSSEPLPSLVTKKKMQQQAAAHLQQ